MKREQAVKVAKKALPGWTVENNEQVAAEDAAAGARPEKTAPPLVTVMRKFAAARSAAGRTADAPVEKTNGVVIVRMKSKNTGEDAPSLSKAAVIDESGKMIGMEG